MIKFKKLLFVLVAFIFVFAMTSSVSASQNIVINTTTNTTTNTISTPNTAGGNTTLELVENNICTITVGDYGRFEKKITEFNETEKSATLTLTFTNTKTVEETYKDVEIFFVIDNSTSMLEEYNGVTRKQAVINSANSLANKLFESNPNVEIGIVGFSTSDQEGTISDAELRLGLSNSQEEVQNAITNLADYQDGPRTNIQAGLTVAQNNFTTEEGKDRYIVLLTDGVPNTTITGVTQKYSGEVATQTKSTIEEIENSGIHWTDGNMIRIHNTIIPKKSRLNVAFVGGMSPAKGSRIAYNLIKHSKKDITWYIMGGIGDKDLEALQQENLIKIGWYEREQLTDLMKFYNIDLVCILPTWAETFCYTLSESWLCNIPVIASDLGAVGERVKKVGGGWIVNGNSSYEEILKIIESLDRDSEQYLKMKERISHINIRPLEEMADDYYTFYEMLLVGNKPTYDSISIEERQELFKGFLLANKEK